MNSPPRTFEYGLEDIFVVLYLIRVLIIKLVAQVACNLGYSRMQGIRRRSKERGSNTIAWTEEIIVGSNDAAEK